MVPLAHDVLSQVTGVSRNQATRGGFLYKQERESRGYPWNYPLGVLLSAVWLCMDAGRSSSLFRGRRCEGTPNSSDFRRCRLPLRPRSCIDFSICECRRRNVES